MDVKNLRKRSFNRFDDARKRVESYQSQAQKRSRAESIVNIDGRKSHGTSSLSLASGTHQSRPVFRQSIAGQNMPRQSIFSVGSRFSFVNSRPNPRRGRRSTVRSTARSSIRNAASERASKRKRFSFFSFSPRKSIQQPARQELPSNLPKWETRETLEGVPYYWNNEEQDFTWDKPTELMNEKERAEISTEWCWIPHPTLYWQPAQLIDGDGTGGKAARPLLGSRGGPGQIVRIDKKGFKRGEITAGEYQRVPCTPFPRKNLDIIVSDLVDLDTFHAGERGTDANEGAVLHNTRIRYENGEIYTWIGATRQILLAINPYEDLGLYSTEKMDYYQATADAVKVPPPHVFGIAAACLDGLVNESRDQSILVSGESGAGKTQATKQCLDFLTHIAGTQKAEPGNRRGGGPGGRGPGGRGPGGRGPGGRGPGGRGRGPGGRGPKGVAMKDVGANNSLEDKIMVANPLLEAFGNAKTTRNNNSSRFGKWIGIYFNPHKKKIAGAKIENFLLETPRVIYQAKDERNYHIFYELFTDAEMSAKFQLGAPEDYRYLNQSGCVSVDGIDDAKELVAVREAMRKLDFDDDKVEWMFKVVAALLHLGNVSFKEVKEDKISKTVIENPDTLAIAADLLGLSVDDLGLVLVERTMKLGGEVTRVPLKLRKANDARDSLAKAVYGKLFDYIVEEVNEAFGEGKGRLIGILDIFGFEMFETNSFEQLCINYTNEKLQELFNKDIFDDEKLQFQLERIKFDSKSFISRGDKRAQDNNKIVIEMIGGEQGIFRRLDDEGKAGKPSEEQFLRIIEGDHEKKGVNIYKKGKAPRSFVVGHFAGSVEYLVDGFLLKNTNTLNQNLYDVCSKSTEDYTTYLFPKMDGSARLKLLSTSGKFKEQLRNLLNLLGSTATHYIRCIKPNKEQKPKFFNGRKIIKQLNASGVIGTIKQIQKGFPYRMLHKDFYRVYKNVCGPNVKYSSNPNDAKARCEEIVKLCFQQKTKNLVGIQVGTIHVLFRREEFRFLELSRTLAFAEFLPKVQAIARKFLAQRFYERLQSISQELEEAVKTSDLNAIDQIERELPNRFGVLGKLYGIKPKSIEKARKQVQRQQLWQPLFRDLNVYSRYTDETSAEDLTVTEDELGELIKNCLVLEETERMPSNVREAFNNVKKLRKRLHTARMNEKFLALLKPASKVEVSVKTSAEEFAQKETLEESVKIEDEGQKAIDDLDKEELREVVLHAEEIDYTSDVVDKAKQLLVSEYEYTKTEYERATDTAEKKKLRERLIYLRESELAKDFDKYKYFYTYPGLREPVSFLKSVQGGGCCSADTVVDIPDQKYEPGKKVSHRVANRVRKNLLWSNQLLNASLTKLSPEHQQEAISLFSGLFIFMEEDESDADGLAVVQTGQGFPDMRDELYTQIIKQLTNNMTATSVMRGVEMLGLCFTAFPPQDEEFAKYLFVWCRTHLPYTIFRHYMSAVHEAEFGEEKQFANLDEVRYSLDNTSRGSRWSTRITSETDPWEIPVHHFNNILEDYDIMDGFFSDFETEEELRAKDSAVMRARQKLGTTLARLSHRAFSLKPNKQVGNALSNDVVEVEIEGLATLKDSEV